MNPDAMDLLELFPARRYVALSEAEAAELGSGALNEWRVASENGVHIDAMDLANLLRDGARWRRVVGFLTGALMFVGVVGACLIGIAVLALIAQAFS